MRRSCYPAPPRAFLHPLGVELWLAAAAVAAERAGFSPDGLIGMEANLRFAGPETMETKIFARLSAWQNWIFQRPNATGPEGALKLYGTGKQSKYDRKRA